MKAPLSPWSCGRRGWGIAAGGPTGGAAQDTLPADLELAEVPRGCLAFVDGGHLARVSPSTTNKSRSTKARSSASFSTSSAARACRTPARRSRADSAHSRAPLTAVRHSRSAPRASGEPAMIAPWLMLWGWIPPSTPGNTGFTESLRLVSYKLRTCRTTGTHGERERGTAPVKTLVAGTGFEPVKLSRRIYSPLPLAARATCRQTGYNERVDKAQTPITG